MRQLHSRENQWRETDWFCPQCGRGLILICPQTDLNLCVYLTCSSQKCNYMSQQHRLQQLVGTGTLLDINLPHFTPQFQHNLFPHPSSWTFITPLPPSWNQGWRWICVCYSSTKLLISDWVIAVEGAGFSSLITICRTENSCNNIMCYKVGISSSEGSLGSSSCKKLDSTFIPVTKYTSTCCY